MFLPRTLCHDKPSVAVEDSLESHPRVERGTKWIRLNPDLILSEFQDSWTDEAQMLSSAFIGEDEMFG